MIRLHRVIARTRAEGPGTRFAIWVQGCHNACPGCYAAALQDENGGEQVPVDSLIERLRAAKGIEGITLLGGEPMEQAAALARVARAARDMGLSVLTFTGLIYEKLLAEGDGDRLALLRCTDLLIDGPYIAAQRDLSRPWVGSANQRYLFLSDRYRMEDVESCRNRIEFRLGKDGVLRLNGMGDFGALEALLKEKSITRCEENGIHEF